MQSRKLAILAMGLVGAACLWSPILAKGAAIAPPSQRLSAQELLDRYAQALDPIQSFIGWSESSSVSSYRIPSWGMQADHVRSFSRTEYGTDNKGCKYIRDYRWGYVGRSEPNVAQSTPHYSLYIIGDDFIYHHDRPLGQTRYTGVLDYTAKGQAGFDRVKNGAGDLKKNDSVSFFLGYVSCGARLDGVMKDARRLSVRAEPERINGSLCHIIEADTRYGRFTVWLDPLHGYHPARIRAAVRVGDDIGDPGSPHVITKAEGITRDYSIDITRFEKVGDIWVPMEADTKSHIVLGSENGFSDGQTHFKYTKIVLNPDHKALHSFDDPVKNPKLDPELRNGTKVYLDPPFVGPGTTCTWQDGKIVDSTGKVIDVSVPVVPAKFSLLNAPLPPLSGLSKDLSQTRTSDRPLLLCLFDIQQRPSRQCLSALAEKAASLDVKGVTIVLVQTPKMDLQPHEAWLKALRINSPVHVVESDFEAQKSTWAVKALPWLILTDKSHIVHAEGFAVSDLDRDLDQLK
jgi:hypothetical protein